VVTQALVATTLVHWKILYERCNKELNPRLGYIQIYNFEFGFVSKLRMSTLACIVWILVSLMNSELLLGCNA